jgi:hypothetical protein
MGSALLKQLSNPGNRSLSRSAASEAIRAKVEAPERSERQAFPCFPLSEVPSEARQVVPEQGGAPCPNQKPYSLV